MDQTVSASPESCLAWLVPSCVSSLFKCPQVYLNLRLRPSRARLSVLRSPAYRWRPDQSTSGSRLLMQTQQVNNSCKHMQFNLWKRSLPITKYQLQKHWLLQPEHYSSWADVLLQLPGKLFYWIDPVPEFLFSMVAFCSFAMWLLDRNSLRFGERGHLSWNIVGTKENSCSFDKHSLHLWLKTEKFNNFHLVLVVFCCWTWVFSSEPCLSSEVVMHLLRLQLHLIHLLTPCTFAF